MSSEETSSSPSTEVKMSSSCWMNSWISTRNPGMDWKPTLPGERRFCSPFCRNSAVLVELFQALTSVVGV